MNPLTVGGITLFAITLFMQRFDSIGYSLMIVGLSLTIPEIVAKIRSKKP